MECQSHKWVTVSTTIDKKRQYCKWCGLCREIDYAPPNVIEPMHSYTTVKGTGELIEVPPDFDYARLQREILTGLVDQASLPLTGDKVQPADPDTWLFTVPENDPNHSLGLRVYKLDQPDPKPDELDDTVDSKD